MNNKASKKNKEFYNDIDNLVITSKSINRRKSNNIELPDDDRITREKREEVLMKQYVICKKYNLGICDSLIEK